MPDLPEWDRLQLLATEKETLGFYITGHPLAEHRGLLAKYATTPTEDLPDLQDKSTVRVGAIVTAVKEISTKSGDRMAFVTLEDLTGSVEAVVFPDVYRSSMLHLAKDSAVLVKGQVDLAEDGAAKLLVSEVRPLALSGNGGTPLVEVTLGGDRRHARGAAPPGRHPAGASGERCAAAAPRSARRETRDDRAGDLPQRDARREAPAGAGGGVRRGVPDATIVRPVDPSATTRGCTPTGSLVIWCSVSEFPRGWGHARLHLGV